VTAVDGKYQIGVYTLRPIAEGEEITFDYNSVTEVSTFPVPL
jgi:SET domain-containing protein